MELIRCHIDNFGKLHDIDLDFKDGLNIFLRENGYGKSTMAAFFRAMFYGLPDGEKAGEAENGRKRYSPWQGGVFGGELCFLRADKKYRVERRFGRVKSEDSFALFDMENNTASSDFSEKLGEELFGVDEETWCRTAFARQQDVSWEVGSGIHEKIGSISDMSYDMRRYAEGMEKLKDEMNALSPNRRTGRIFQLKMKLEQISTDLESMSDMEGKKFVTDSRLRQTRWRQTELKKKMEETRGKIKAAAHYQEMLSLKMAYGQLKDARDRTGDEAREAERKYFEDYRPSFPEDGRAARMREDGQELNARFRNGFPSEEEIRHAEKIFSRAGFLIERLRLSVQERESDGRKGILLSCVLLATGLFLLICAIVFTRANSSGSSMGAWIYILALLMLLAGFLILTYGILSSRNRWQLWFKKSGTGKNHSRMSEEDMKNEAERLSRELDVFLSRFYELPHSQSEAERRSTRGRFLRKLGRDGMRWHRLTAISALEKDYESKSKTLEKFESEHNPDEFLRMEEPGNQENIDKLSESLQVLSGRLNELEDEILAGQEESNQLRIKMQELYSQEVEYELGMEELQELENRHALLVLTRDHLAKAKENFSRDYRNPLMESFGRYYLAFLGTEAWDKDAEMIDKTPFRMDEDFNLQPVYEGEGRDLSLLSEGCRDMAALCRRFAFVDAMYPGEKPFLILDDPFVNLDQDKIAAGLCFLREISKEYQILYFTCHESRA